MLTKNDMHYFVKASQVAEISDFAKINIGCIAVYQGTIIGVDFNTNKTHPMQKKYNIYRNGENFTPKLHAEINCLNSIRYLDINFPKVKLYIYRKRKFFEEQRDIYNKTHDPLVFFFIMRTTTNGMPRYNQKGEFNNSFHVTRNGIKPELLKPILTEWSVKLRKNNVEFGHRSYEEILGEVKEGDFIYMDPPYFNTKGMYFGGIDFESFFVFLENVSKMNVRFALSFDGKSGNVDNTYNIPNDCYRRHFYIKSGNSSFKRTIGKDKNAIVYESLYLNYDGDNGLW